MAGDVLRWAADFIRASGRLYTDLVDRAEDMIQSDTLARRPSAAGRRRFYYATDTGELFFDAGAWVQADAASRSFSTASQGPGFGVDTYITSSGILIPSYGMVAGQLYRWQIGFSKTAFGAGAPALTFRIGANQTVGDTARLALNGQAGAAAVSGGILFAQMLVRSVSATGVVAGAFGFAAGILGPGGGIEGVGAAFDNTVVAGSYLGLSLNSGLGAAWTISSVYGELVR